MRLHLVVAALLVATPQAIATPALVSAPPARNEECNARWNALSAEDKTKLDYANFTQTCANDLSSNPDPRPVATNTKPLADVTGMCRDHTYTENRNRKKACLRQGGIQMWFAGR
jgi:hypothetical protein